MAKSNFIVRGGADFSGIDAQMKKLDNKFGAFQGKMNKSFNIAGIAKGAAAIAAVTLAVKAVIAVAKPMQEAYMKLESSVMRVNDIFGNASNSIHAFAENTASSFGMAESTAYEYAATYGNLFRYLRKAHKRTQRLLKRCCKRLLLSRLKRGEQWRTLTNVSGAVF